MADFESLRAISDDEAMTRALYDEVFREKDRLTSRAAQVEFLTTVKFAEEYIPSGSRILDVGAGAGDYSIYFARRGCSVDAVELSERNIEDFRARIAADMPIRLRQGNALDLSAFDDGTFDAVFVFGPLYHLHSPEDRKRAVLEAARVCRDDGTLFFSFISHDMVFMTELSYDPDYFCTGDFDPDTMRLTDFPFVFATPPECRELLASCGLEVIREVASDGASELMADRINAMDDESYRRYLKYHFYRCEKPEILGFTNHLLYIAKK